MAKTLKVNISRRGEKTIIEAEGGFPSEDYGTPFWERVKRLFGLNFRDERHINAGGVAIKNISEKQWDDINRNGMR